MESAVIHFLNQSKNIPEAFFEIAQRYPDREVYRQAVIDATNDCEEIPRAWRGRTYRQVLPRIRAIGRFLLEAGVAPGDRVAIVSNTRAEWMEADIGILSVGGVAVSIYQSLVAVDVGYILYDSGARVVFAENQEQVEKLLALHQKPFQIPATEERPAGEVSITLLRIVTFERTTEHPLVTFLGDILNAPDIDATEIQKRSSTAARDDLAALVYTSGTTGAPKGVMQTHGNHLSNVRQVFESGLIHDDNTIFLLLPLAHSFAKLMGYIGFLTPVRLFFPGVADTKSSRAIPTSVTKDLREGGAQLVPVVPRLLEKMQAAIVNKSKERSFASALLRLALRSGAAVAAARAEGEMPSPLHIACYSILGFIRRKVRKRLFGANFQFGISGGAKLPTEVARFFASIDAVIYEGYGLTETCVATNVGRPGLCRIHTVGPVLARDIQLRIAEDGEILFKGPNITSGYWQRPTATAQSWDAEGWFHTGDLGSVDTEGLLSIEGRKKELIVTSGGKKIPPDPIEQRLKATGFVSQAVLVGEGKNYVVALVTLDEAAVRQWAQQAGVVLQQSMHAQREVQELINREVEKLNLSLASFETVKRVAILSEEMTVENGLLTPTFKVKRKEVAKRFSDLIESLYAESRSE
ncbi:MAG: long-chain fatty acid--CoA ligase [Proteobacteria bacterium]|nr:long-chain fatty acid--CoA ligase [Pseudomonadota bacterium]